jgi:hypothetical protein
MREDPELQHELKRGLVQRFVEHPSRLVEKNGDMREETVRIPPESKSLGESDEIDDDE